MYDTEKQKVIKEVDVGYVPQIVRNIPNQEQNAILIGETENQCEVWNMNEGKKQYQISTGQSHITDLSFQPLNDYCIFGSKEKSWSFYDLKTQKCLSKIDTENEINSIAFHPDGLMLATGHQDRSLSIWDIRTQNVFTTIKNEDINGSALTHICFSNKGYQFAAGWKGSNIVKLFDMRKNFSSVPITVGDTEPSSICFDAFGSYLLATCENKLRMYSGKTWNPHFVEVTSEQKFSKCSFSKANMKVFGLC